MSLSALRRRHWSRVLQLAGPRESNAMGNPWNGGEEEEETKSDIDISDASAAPAAAAAAN
jgi:hypothetical protein|uniref:Uncharacterized protein n=1 Tax=Oryza barthii TaxID=65489 RepID=A0A0D3HJR3_9ORYZ